MFNTNFCFKPGKLTTVLDGQAGSSGKGKLNSFVCSHANNWQFACTTAAPQAGHWVMLDDGRRFFYQTFPSCAYQVEKYEKLYLAPGATIELPAFWREIEENKINRKAIGISPVTSILQDIDGGYERGTHDFSGTKWPGAPGGGGPLAATGTTAHGCGANRARRVLRRKEAKYARDVPELKEFLCDVPGEIMARLDRGQSGLLEIAQGFQLSYMLPDFFPYTTSRNCTVAAGLDDMMLPPKYAGPVIINLRTYPIRINSNKYLDGVTGEHLTMTQVVDKFAARNAADQALLDSGGHRAFVGFVEAVSQASDHVLKAHGVTVVRGSSGPGYPDQQEVSWSEVTKSSGSPEPLMEMTSVTKLPRRVFTFSRQNLEEAIRHNATGDDVHLSVNFMNYVDARTCGLRGTVDQLELLIERRGRPLPPLVDAGGDPAAFGHKAYDWLTDNIAPHLPLLRFIGTGPLTDSKVVIARP